MFLFCQAFAGICRLPSSQSQKCCSGTTRDNFQGRAVATLCYSAYRPRALRSMHEIAADVRARHGLLSVAIVHRLGPVPIGEDSILIAVSAPHRKAAWQAGEECLERVKERVEIWKQEVFTGEGEGAGAEDKGEPERVWRANKDGVPGQTRLD